jgi:putative tricarboxylic transport membrane protein
MSDDRESQHRAGTVVGTHAMEIAVAVGLFGFGLVVIGDSVRIGRGWAPDGPEAGFYPFYVGLTLCGASGWIGLRHWRKGSGAPFINELELRRVLSVLVPSIAFVACMFWLGLYVASVPFLIGFVHFLGKYSWQRAVPMSIAVVAGLFALFELWLAVPLPKGPLEAWLGI